MRGLLSLGIALSGWLLRRRKRASPMIATILAGTVLIRVERLKREATDAENMALREENRLLRLAASSDGHLPDPGTTLPLSRRKSMKRTES